MEAGQVINKVGKQDKDEGSKVRATKKGKNFQNKTGNNGEMK